MKKLVGSDPDSRWARLLSFVYRMATRAGPQWRGAGLPFGQACPPRELRRMARFPHAVSKIPPNFVSVKRKSLGDLDMPLAKKIAMSFGAHTNAIRFATRSSCLPLKTERGADAACCRPAGEPATRPKPHEPWHGPILRRRANACRWRRRGRASAPPWLTLGCALSWPGRRGLSAAHSPTAQ